MDEICSARLFLASLMAIPANFTSFCLASTFDKLSFPTNLKKWRITTEAMYTLCKKEGKVPRKKSPPVRILYYPSDVILLADLNSNYCCLQSCLREENPRKESWQSTKVNRY